MPFRFRRSIRIAPGVRVNVSRSGFSTSVGERGAHVTFGKRGTRASAGIPGSGLSYSDRIDRPARRGRAIVGLAAMIIVATLIELILR